MRRRSPTRGNRPPATSETTSRTGSDTDDDPVYDPNSDTDLTEPDCPSPGPRKASAKGNKHRETPTREGRAQCPQAKSVEPPTEGPNRKTSVSATELQHRAHYEVPADDTDEELSKIPEDYGKAGGTKKLNLRLKEHWIWFVVALHAPAASRRAAERSSANCLAFLGSVGPNRSSRQPS